MKYIASVSFGKDSLAMLLRLIDEKDTYDKFVDDFGKRTGIKRGNIHPRDVIVMKKVASFMDRGGAMLQMYIDAEIRSMDKDGN